MFAEDFAAALVSVHDYLLMHPGNVSLHAIVFAIVFALGCHNSSTCMAAIHT